MMAGLKVSTAIALAVAACSLVACSTTREVVTPAPAGSPAGTPPTVTEVTTPGLLDRIITRLNKDGDRFIKDLQVSAVDARAHQDKRAYTCYEGLVPIVKGLQAKLGSFVPTQTTTPSGAGLVYIFQRGRDVKGDITSPSDGFLKSLQEDLDVACGGLQRDTVAGVFDPMGLLTGQ